MKYESKNQQKFAIAVAAVFNLFIATVVFGQMGGSAPTGGSNPDTMQSDNPFFKKAKATPAPSPGAMTTASKISQKDRTFLLNMASAASWEAKTGSSTEDKLQNSSAKSVASRIVADHTSMSNELVQLGKKKGLALSVESKGQKIPGPNYDKNYLQLVGQDLRESIGHLQKEAQSGDDADVKAFANKWLGIVRHHSASVQEAEGKVK